MLPKRFWPYFPCPNTSTFKLLSFACGRGTPSIAGVLFLEFIDKNNEKSVFTPATLAFLSVNLAD